jgi:hypothetical protein
MAAAAPTLPVPVGAFLKKRYTFLIKMKNIWSKLGLCINLKKQPHTGTRNKEWLREPV